MSCWRIHSDAFTLVEVLVALTVTTVGLVGAIGALSMAQSAAGRVEALRQAQVLAESRLNLGVVGPLDQMGQSEGSEGRFRWTVDIEPSHHQRLAEIVVRVTWREGFRTGRYELATLRPIETSAKGG